MDLVQPTHVEARDNYRIWVEYADGVSGEIDLSDLAVEPMFSAWQDSTFWRSVHITDYRAIAWNDDLELCPDSIYMDLTGRTLREIYPPPANQRAHV